MTTRRAGMIRIETEEGALRSILSPRRFGELCAIARSAPEPVDLPIDYTRPGPRGGRRIGFGDLGVGDRFYIRGEFWAPYSRHGDGWPAVREPVREVLDVEIDANGPDVTTNEEGVAFRFSDETIVYLVDEGPDRFPPPDWLDDSPWIAPTLRRLAREDEAGIRVDPRAACHICDGFGCVTEEGGTRVCPRCQGRRLDGRDLKPSA